MKDLKVLPFFYLVLCLALLWQPAHSSAAPKQHIMTETELLQLESNLSKLKSINLTSQSELKALKNNLALSKIELSMAKQQLGQLQAELMSLKQTSEAQQASLKIANESLVKFAEEEKAKQNKLKQQRTLAYIVAGTLAIAYIRK